MPVNNFVEKNKSVALLQSGTISLKGREFKVQRSPKTILKALYHSRIFNKTVGACVKTLGEGMCLTVVDHIYFNDNGETAVFKPCDATEQPLQKTKMTIHEIGGIYPFNTIDINTGLDELAFIGINNGVFFSTN
ncbi:MAG: hypothetical protein ACOYXT_18595 [Bacteroidota bacterium]